MNLHVKEHWECYEMRPWINSNLQSTLMTNLKLAGGYLVQLAVYMTLWDMQAHTYLE